MIRASLYTSVCCFSIIINWNLKHYNIKFSNAYEIVEIHLNRALFLFSTPLKRMVVKTGWHLGDRLLITFIDAAFNKPVVCVSTLFLSHAILFDKERRHWSEALDTVNARAGSQSLRLSCSLMHLHASCQCATHYNHFANHQQGCNLETKSNKVLWTRTR